MKLIIANSLASFENVIYVSENSSFSEDFALDINDFLSIERELKKSLSVRLPTLKHK